MSGLHLIQYAVRGRRYSQVLCREHHDYTLEHLRNHDIESAGTSAPTGTHCDLCEDES